MKLLLLLARSLGGLPRFSLPIKRYQSALLDVIIKRFIFIATATTTTTVAAAIAAIAATAPAASTAASAPGTAAGVPIVAACGSTT